MDATERFDKRVIKSEDVAGCWVWVGALGDDGYGRFWVKDSATGRQKVYRSHRYALQVALGLSDAQMNLVHVLHRCDNPLCVRATDGSDSHLVVGDHELNMQDRPSAGGRLCMEIEKFTRKRRVNFVMLSKLMGMTSD